MKKLFEAWSANDKETVDTLTHNHFVMHSHAQSDAFSKDEYLEFMGANPKIEKFRVIYENDDIGVCHQYMEFESGDKEAVMMVYEIKDGQIISLETGATPLPS